jgi:hypothetical protein
MDSSLVKQKVSTGEHPICVDLGEGSPPSFRRVDDLRRGESLVTFGRNASNTPTQTPVEVSGVSDVVLKESVESACSAERLRNADPHLQQCMHGGDAQRNNDSGQGVSHLRQDLHHRKVRAWAAFDAWGFIPFLLKRVLWDSPFKNLRWGKPPQLQSSRNEVHAKTYRTHRPFCSRECYGNWLVGRATQTGTGRAGLRSYPPEFKTMRRKLLTNEATCVVCMFPARDLHHKDNNIENNSPENLAVVCRRCHKRHHMGPPHPELSPSKK